jgi:hypothetical protein
LGALPAGFKIFWLIVLLALTSEMRSIGTYCSGGFQSAVWNVVCPDNRRFGPYKSGDETKAFCLPLFIVPFSFHDIETGALCNIIIDPMANTYHQIHLHEEPK